MTNILATVGPVSEKNLVFFGKKTSFVRFNLSHNTISWHKKNIRKLKKLYPNKLILVDIPGIKPRTLNKIPIYIKKGEKVSFSNKTAKENTIKLSNPLPKIKKNSKNFFLSDGMFEFKSLEINRNVITGVSQQNFTLKPKKGLNIPFSTYDDIKQEKLYLKYIKTVLKLNVDCVGLSFVQSSKIIKKLKKKYPNLIYISKIENFHGYLNREEIIKHSDAVMIDRGDLAAEIGLPQLSSYSNDIIQDSKRNGKPIIIATENLNSLMHESIPSKSDIVNLDYYLNKEVDYIMLSDETTTSKNWKNTLSWLNLYLKSKNKILKKNSVLDLANIIKSIKNETLVVFSKKGHFYEKISNISFSKLIIFTENKRLEKVLRMKKNIYPIHIKFPKDYLYNFLFENLKRNKNLIFKNNKFAYLINVIFPRKNSRANNLSIINKIDFK